MPSGGKRQGAGRKEKPNKLVRNRPLELEADLWQALESKNPDAPNQEARDLLRLALKDHLPKES